MKIIENGVTIKGRAKRSYSIQGEIKAEVKETSKPKRPDFNKYIQMVENKAFELYEKRGCQPGHDQEDWLEAEKLVEEELCR